MPHLAYKRIARSATLVLVGVLTFFATADQLVWAAEVPNPGLIQQMTRTATPDPETWESKPLGGEMYVNVYVGGEALTQNYAGDCRASYTNGSLFVWVRILRCTKPGRSTVAVRYLSVTGPQKFKLRITRKNPVPLGFF